MKSEIAKAGPIKSFRNSREFWSLLFQKIACDKEVTSASSIYQDIIIQSCVAFLALMIKGEI